MGEFSKQAPGGPRAARWEAAGLAWLAEAGGASVVEVIDVDRATVRLRRLVPAAPTRTAAEEFGRALAVTHAAGADAFAAPPPGWTGDGWIGRQTQTMIPTPRWGESFADQRVRPFVRAAVDAGHLAPDGAALVETICERLTAGEFDDDRPPARIHGDLWSGNVMWTSDGVVLIDPAAHGGHGLTDLAMLELFGCPHLDVVQNAYAQAAGLEPGWRDLIGLHQLHPLAVHAVSHGSAYGAELALVARRYT